MSTDINLISYLPGIWQGGLEIFGQEFSDTWQYAALGTHTANDAMLYIGTYLSYNYELWLKFCHVVPDEGTLSAIAEFSTYNGITYTAVYYAETYANVRGMAWV